MLTEKIIKKAAIFLHEKRSDKTIPIEVYIYGLQLLFSNVNIVVAILLISSLFDSIFIGLLYMLIYVSLKVTSGGYHAKTSLGCFLVSIFNFLSVLFLSKILTEICIRTIFWIVFLLLMVLFLLINKPLISKRRKVKKEAIRKNKIISTIIIIFISGVTIVGYCFCNDTYILNFIVLTIASVAIGILLGRKERKNYV